MSSPDAQATPAGAGPAASAEEKNALREFAVEFIKILTTTAIYSKDHPVTQKMAGRPFEMFQSLPFATDEMSFLSDQSGGGAGADLTIEGVSAESLALSSVLRSSMSEHFLGKLRTYFDKNRILNLAVKKGIDEDEFTRFVSVMVANNAELGQEWEDADRGFDFSDALIKAKVVNVSVLLWTDLLGKDRRIPWRVKVAFGRLRKDLRNLPLFQRATGQELREAKRQIVQDIIRPLMRPDFIKDLLVNADLVTEGITDLEDVALEDEIISCLMDTMLAPLVWEVVGDLDLLRAKSHDDPERKKAAESLEYRMLTVLRSVAARFVERDDPEAYPTLRQLFDRNILRLGDLPEALKRRVLQESWTNKFLEDSDKHLRRFAESNTAEGIRAFLESFTLVLPELIAREKYELSMQVARIIRKRMADDELFKKIVRSERDEIFADDLLVSLEGALHKARKQDRVALLGLLDFYRDKVVEFLVRVLVDAKDAALRREACDALVKTGRRGVPAICAALNAHGYDWFVARNLLMVLGVIGDVSAAPDVQRFLTHPNIRCREEAVVAVARVRGRAAEPYLLDRLADSSRAVRRRTLQTLGSAGSVHPRYMTELEKLMEDPGSSVEEDSSPLDLQLAVLHSLEKLGSEQKLPSGKRVIQLLHEQIASVGGLSKVPLLSRFSQAPADPEVIAESCRILGRFGGREEIRRLLKMTRNNDARIAGAARDAVTAIEHRLRNEAHEEQD